MTKAYLGDSVYCEIENGMIKLTTFNGYLDDPRNVIYLEQQVFYNLLAYVKRVEAIYDAVQREVDAKRLGEPQQEKTP